MKQFVLLLALTVVSTANVIPRDFGKWSHHVGLLNADQPGRPVQFSKSKVSLDERLNCTAGLPDGEQPPIRTDTSAQVSQLINDAILRGYDGYIVTHGDAHQSEFTEPCEERVSYISGFAGEAGTAVILANGPRALWTDGRYFLEADEVLGCDWLLMKTGLEGVPSVSEWILQNLPSDSVISADARLVDANSWLSLDADLSSGGLSTVADTITDGNGVLDAIWNNDGRPECSNEPMYVHPLKYAGVTWQQKIADILVEMETSEAEAYVITMLDETAWTLNVRGADVPYNPVFPSYLIVDGSDVEFQASVTLYVDSSKVGAEVSTHLSLGNCSDPNVACVTLADYNSIETGLLELNENTDVRNILTPSAYNSPGVSFYIYNLISPSKRLSQPSPAFLMKAAKNPAESEAMRHAHLKDGVALMSYLSFMEDEMAAGNYWDELTGLAELDRLRSVQDEYVSLSFDTISAYGPNGAIIHYASSPATNVQIKNDSLYLLDSGGQYMDGTTDVTRTLYYGDNADPKMKEAYTRVLQGQIDFATIVYPKGTAKYYIDVVARRSLYSVGWDYRHGTSHGVGMLLNVHEGSDNDFELGFFGSDEPGYYEDGAFGVRLENVVTVVEKETKYDFFDVAYGFDTVTLCPYEPKLIDLSILTTEQCNYLNSYNAMVRTKTSPELMAQLLSSVNDWMMSKTELLVCQ